MIKVFEKFLDFESVMTNFRDISRLLINNPPENNTDISWNDYTIVVQLVFGKDNSLSELVALIYEEESGLGSIQINFADPKNNGGISVCYDLGTCDERVTEHFNLKQINKKKLVKPWHNAIFRI